MAHLGVSAPLAALHGAAKAFDEQQYALRRSGAARAKLRLMDEFLRVVGRRVQHPTGELPSAEARQAMTHMAQYLTRTPKGVFRYKSHDEANRDRENWRIAAMLAKQQSG